MESVFKDDVLVSLTTWSKEGQVTNSGAVDRDSKQTGAWIEVDANGQRNEGTYAHGEKTGPWKATLPDGTTMFVPFLKGKPHGVSQTFDPGGSKIGEVVMKNGTMMTNTAWSPDRKSVKKCFYKNGVEARCETIVDPALLNPSNGRPDSPARKSYCRETVQPRFDECVSACGTWLRSGGANVDGTSMDGCKKICMFNPVLLQLIKTCMESPS
jgi:hypothetical protein